VIALRFTDDYLLQNDLRIQDPEAEQSLLETVPDNGEVPSLVGWYNVRPEGGKRNPDYSDTFVWCAHCRGRRHWAGYLARYSDGTGILIGNVCGNKQYGVDFDRVENEFISNKNRQTYLRQFAALKASIAPMVAELHAATNSDVVSRFHDLRKHLAYYHGEPIEHRLEGEVDKPEPVDRALFPFLSVTMGQVVIKNGNQLFRTIKERDFEAEERERERLQEKYKEYDSLTVSARTRWHQLYGRPKREVPKIFRPKPQNFAALQGGDLFRFEVKPKVQLQALWEQAKGMYAEDLRASTESYSTSELKRIVLAFRDIADTAFQVREQLTAPDAFFEPRNLANVVECMNSVLEYENKLGKYSSDGNGIRFIDSSGEAVDATNNRCQPLELRHLEEFRRALSPDQPAGN
jgi:hypothetical protein